MNYAIELGHEVIAFTEHETVSNAIKIEEYYDKIKNENPNFKIIRGNEIYLCRNGLNNETYIRGEDKYYHFILLAKDAIGHKQIRELSTRAWGRSYMGGGLRRVPTYYKDLEEIIKINPGHIIASTACIGSYPAQFILNNLEDNIFTKEKELLEWFQYIESIFGKENFFLEMQPSENNEQIVVNKTYLDFAKKYGYNYIITCDEHYLKKEDADIHEAYLNSQDGDREVKSFYATTYLMSDQEIRSFFDSYFTGKDIEFAYKNILKIKDMCEDYTLKKPLKIPELEWKEPKVKRVDEVWFERIPMLKTFQESDYHGDKVLVRAIVSKILSDKRLQNQETYDALNSNLKSTWDSSVKNNAHWSAYFLNLQKNIDLIWEAGSLVGCGRGSGAGFLLLYILDIIQINPLWEKAPVQPWRFLNPDRVSVLDIDSDIEGSKRGKVLARLREYYGEDRVANVATFGTEGSKQAIATAIRGLGYDVDLSLYLSSLIPADRGKVRTLHQCYYGDEKNDFKPVYEFKKAMDDHEDIWKVAQKIEGLTCRLGEHAGGVIFVDEPFTESTALMRAPNGDIITQFDLHDDEKVSLIKIDLLSVEYLDKLHTCLDLLIEYNYIKPEPTLRETYEKYIGIYNLERDDPDMWNMVWNHKIQSLFQMEKQSGVQGIALTHPKSVEDLATLNSVIRLQAEEKGAEQPLNKYTRFKNNPNLWIKEMDKYGLTEHEKEVLKPIVGNSYGIAECQEKIMLLVQLPECGGYSLGWSDKLRKSVAKKDPAQYEALQKEFFENAKEKNLSMSLCLYVWNVLVSMSRGYSFCLSHTLSYSLAALQEMNLAFKYPIIFWDTACLITDSGGTETEEGDTKVTNYEKIATALGKMQQAGIKIVPPNINKSRYTFSPNVETNEIIFGLSGISFVGEDVIQDVIKNRPYSSVIDYYEKCHPKKQSIINLIKGGAFDELESNRNFALALYLWHTCDKKKRITLQNLNGLDTHNILPKEDEYKTPYNVYRFNKYLKSYCKTTGGFNLDNSAIDFLSFLEKEDKIDFTNNVPFIKENDWKKIYDSYMDTYRNWINNDKENILKQLNEAIFLEEWNKYAEGNLSHWEMESLCYYYHDHELKNLNTFRYGVIDFNSLPEQPIPVKSFKKGDHIIDMYNLVKIAGTCIAKNKDKATVTLLTTTGVVNVKLRKEQFAFYDKQISQINEKGEKKIIEKSWFTRGNMIMVQGIRRDNQFFAKKYASTPGHTIYKISKVNEETGTVELQYERAQNDD